MSEEKKEIKIDINDYYKLLNWSQGYMMWEGSETVDYESLEEDMSELKEIEKKYEKRCEKE